MKVIRNKQIKYLNNLQREKLINHLNSLLKVPIKDVKLWILMIFQLKNQKKKEDKDKNRKVKIK